MIRFKKVYPLMLLLTLICIGNANANSSMSPVSTGPQKEVSIVNNPSNSKNGVKEYTLQESLSVGNDTDEKYTFGKIKRVHLDRNLNMYVLDYKQDKVFMYDRNGKFVRSFGNKGEGPGAQLLPNYIAVDDRREMVHILDLRIGKISRYFINGRFDRDIKLRGSKPGKFHLTQDGFYFLNDTKSNDDGSYSVIILKYDLDGQPIGKGKNLTFRSQSGKFVKTGGQTLLFKHPLMYRSHICHDKEGNTFHGYSDKYEISIYDSDLNKIKIIRKEAPDVEVSSGAKAFVFKHYRDLYKKKGIKVTEEMMQFDKYYQKFYGLWTDDKQQLIVNTDIKENKAHFDVFDKEGTYIERWILTVPDSSISMDAIATNPTFKDDSVYSTVMDEDGLLMIKKYRLKNQGANKLTGFKIAR